jgi:intracellular septation protein
MNSAALQFEPQTRTDMKLLTDFFPIALFFITFKLAGIYAATGVAIGATLLQIGWLHFRHGKVEAMQWVSLGIIVLFGGATLVFHDDTFIKWKPTVLYWLMGGALVFGSCVAEAKFFANADGCPT